MTVHWYRVKKTYAKPQGGFLAIGPRYPGVLSDDGLVVLFTHWATHSGPRWFPSSSSGVSGGAEAASTWEVVRRDAASRRSSHASISGRSNPEIEHAATTAAAEATRRSGEPGPHRSVCRAALESPARSRRIVSTVCVR